MKTLLSNPSSILTINTNGINYKRGSEFQNVNYLSEHSIIIENDKIADVVSNSSLSSHSFDRTIELNGKTVLPGLVECHTHSVFSGSRADEFRQKLAGADYEEIARSGGGINATVKAVHQSSFEELVSLAKPRIDNFISQGITTLEIKSGYGLDFANEIKILQVINFLNEIYAIDIIPTFLGAHTFPPEAKRSRDKYVDLITEKMLPHIAKQKLAIFCDGFCESTAFSHSEINKILIKAKELGLKLKLHTDQFNSIGGIDTAINNNAVSVEHLEFINEVDIKKFRNSDIVAVLLPGVSFFLKYQYAPARKLIENNAIVALSTDFNPGSSHISSLSLIMSLASLNMGMTIEETINAVTINAAKALGVENKVGSIEIGKSADFSIFDTEQYEDIVYDIGRNLNCMTIKKGKIIYNTIN